MPVIDQSIIIARPAAEVLDFLVRAENLARRDSSILGCVQLDPAPVTVGTGESVDRQLAFTIPYDLSAVSEGTRLYRLAADSGLGGAFGREPLIEKPQAKVVKANPATLVRLLEPEAA
jgi:hypothetical protein